MWQLPQVFPGIHKKRIDEQNPKNEMENFACQGGPGISLDFYLLFSWRCFPFTS